MTYRVEDMQGITAWKRLDAVIKQQEQEQSQLNDIPKNSFVNRKNTSNQNNDELASLYYMKLIRNNMRKV